MVKLLCHVFPWMQVVTNLYVNETYVLYQCGTGRPAADVVPEGSKFFEIPLTSVSVIETVPYAYMVGAHGAAYTTAIPLLFLYNQHVCSLENLPLF